MPDSILNLVNFVRGCEPRKQNWDLYTPVVQEIAVNRAHGLPATFLLQYDALVRPDFRELFLRERDDSMELGLWLEMNRPLTEAAGIAWRGRPGYDWDWYVNPGFLPAYTPQQREALIDEAFRLFRETFGHYPRVAGAWVMDAYSMDYMSQRYGMDAFCICREQYAVDAYTLWGGYYNGGYYPSRNNMLCPAQRPGAQIPVPVFRMLGIDPIYGYDEARHHPRLDGCYTMEPYWPCGHDREVMEWYFRCYFGHSLLAGGHATTGQENSFGWPGIGPGYRLQAELAQKYRRAGLLRVETLGQTGAAFRRRYACTPSSVLAALEDWSGNDLQSVWYSCAGYRANLFRDGGTLLFRDIQRFDDRLEETYLHTPCEGWQAAWGNLPLVDNRLWSSSETEAALGICEPVAAIAALRESGRVLEATIRFRDGHVGSIFFDESGITLRDCGRVRWRFGRGDVLGETSPGRQEFSHGGFGYSADIRGRLHRQGSTLEIEPQGGEISVRFPDAAG